MKDKGKLWHDRMLNDSFLKLLDNRISASKNQGFDRACEFFMRCPATYFQTWLLISTSLCWNLKPIYSISWTLYRKWKIINHDWPKKQKNSWEPYCDIIFSCGRRLIHEQENTLLACLLHVSLFMQIAYMRLFIIYGPIFPPFPCQWQNLSLTRIFSWSDWINMTRTNYLSKFK